MPLGPVDGEEGGLAPLRDHAQQWRCKPLISDALMAQQPIEPGQRTAHLDPKLGGYSLAISNLSHDNTLKTQGISYSNAEGGTLPVLNCLVMRCSVGVVMYGFLTGYGVVLSVENRLVVWRTVAIC
jgi:hypothetical protein